jgi:hypothetical protein
MPVDSKGEAGHKTGDVRALIGQYGVECPKCRDAK